MKKIVMLLTKSFVLSIMLVLAFLCLPAAEVTAQQDSRSVRVRPLATVATLPESSKRYALIVGVDKYADTQITTLGGASNDARSLAEALTRYAGFPADQVTFLGSDEPAERQPTRGNILRRLSNLSAVIPPDGLLLLAFAGHGIERGGQAFLLPADSQVSNDVDLLEQTAINVAQVKDRIRKIGVKQVLMIIDACRNDPVGRATADNPLTAAYTRGFNFDLRNREVQAFATLYATEVGHRAYEYKEKKQGYFTWVLVEGLKGDAANNKGEVTLAGLVKYLQERVPKRVLQDLGPGKDQKPFAVIEGYRADELVISVRDGKALAQTARSESRPEGSSRSTAADGDADSNSRETGVSLPGNSLVGTSWSGVSPEMGEYTIKFLKAGEMYYIIYVQENGAITPKTTRGKWNQSGSDVRMIIGDSYSVMQGTREGSVMKGEGSNREGTAWKWTLFKKD
jgi:hypothetical protein